MTMKLASSVDDVVWLIPFLVVGDKQVLMTNVTVYSLICTIQTLLALGISKGGVAAIEALTPSSSKWSPEIIISLSAGIFLILFGFKLAYEWYKENFCEEDDDDDDGGECAMKVEGDALLNGDALLTDIEQPEPAKGGGKSRTTSALMAVAFLGSIDDLTLFVPMLVGKSISYGELILGSLLAVLIIVCLCVFLTACKPMVRILEAIPLFLIVFVFGAMLVIKTLLAL